MVKRLVKETIINNNLLEKGDYVIIGLSGGPDSMCLFSVLLELQDEFKLSISAVHVNHMLRPTFAYEDQEYVEKFCAKENIPCKVVARDCTKIAKEQGLTEEEAGRNIRYEAFYEMAKELINKGIPGEKIKIAVAQNKNDQAETLLMRIMRGTGVNGLSGIEYKRAGEHRTSIIRPILDVDRSDIEKYCAKKNINPKEDHTNEQGIYTRNKIRLELLPYMAKNFNENIVDTLVRLSQNAKEDNEYIWNQAKIEYLALKKPKSRRSTFVGAKKLIVMDRVGLNQLDLAVRRRIILLAFAEIGLTQDILAAHFNMIDQILLSKSASAKVNLPNNYEISVSYDEAIIYLKTHDQLKKTQEVIQNLHLDIKVMKVREYAQTYEQEFRKVPQSCGIIKHCETERMYRLSVALDYEALESVTENVEQNIVLRSRQQGDYFVPKGMTLGRKKIQDYFVDRKIPKENRDFYKLVAIGKEVLWVFDPIHHWHNEISGKYMVTNSTKKVLLLEISSDL